MLVLQYMKLWSCYWLTLLHKDIPAVCIEWFILNFPFIQFCIACWWTLDSFTLHCYCCWLNSTNKEYVQGSLVVHTTCLYYSINNRVNLKVKWTWVPTVSLLINSTNIYILLGILVSNQPQSSNQYFQNQHTGIHQNAPFPYQKSKNFLGAGFPSPSPRPLGASIERLRRSVGPPEKILATGLDIEPFW